MEKRARHKSIRCVQCAGRLTQYRDRLECENGHTLSLNGWNRTDQATIDSTSRFLNSQEASAAAG